MRSRDAGSGRVPGRGARFRLFAHSSGQMRGVHLTAGTCPYEEDCVRFAGAGRTGWHRTGAMAAAPNGTGAYGPSVDVTLGRGGAPHLPQASASAGLAEFKALAAVRRWSQARPYFRGLRPLAFACPGEQGLSGQSCPLAARSRPGTWEATSTWMAPESSMPEPAHGPTPPPEAGMTSSSDRRAIPLSSTGSRRAG